MNSKSPFAMKSPLHVYKNDQKGNYANPQYVKEEILGVAIGEAITKTSDNIFSGLTEKNEEKKINKERLDISNRNRLEKSAAEPAREVMKGLEYDMNKPSSKSFKTLARTTIPDRPSNLSKSSNTFSDKNAWDSNRNNVQNDARFKGPGGKEKFFTAAKLYREDKGTSINTTFDGGKTRFEDGKRMLAVNMNGSPNKLIEDTMKKSPVKHNASAVGSIAGSQLQSQSAMFGAAAQESLPPPNQVAESGSYAGTGDRMLEMDSNPVGNQSIGRNTDVASQLFGSGQRASMLAMKGTPLHNAGHGENKAHSHSSNKTTRFEKNVKSLISDYGSEHDNVPEKPKKYINPFTATRQDGTNPVMTGDGTPLRNAGHGEKQAHSHPSKTTTKMKPDGLYPGAKYVKGDLVDQDDLLDKTKLDAHLATAVKSDKKGSFIKEKPDSGPGSDIDSAKGFGKKIRLNNMARSGYTANLKDQMDTNKFLFQKTPKK